MKEVLALNGVLVNLALILDVGVAPVLVVLHEPHLGPLHLPLHSELSLLQPKFYQINQQQIYVFVEN